MSERSKRNPLWYPLLVRRAQYKMRPNGSTYRYRSYRVEVAEDCLFRCVYCDCHYKENRGKRNMRIDHFRPWGRKWFKHLVNEPTNLVYACHSCNQLKWHHWPAGNSMDPIKGAQGFIDPFANDRQKFFRIEDDGMIIAIAPPAQYIIELLDLNSVEKIVFRKGRLAQMKANELAMKYRSTDPELSRFIREIAALLRGELEGGPT